MSLFRSTWQPLSVEHRGVTVTAEVRGPVEKFVRSARDWIDWLLDQASDADRALDPSTLLDATWQRVTAGTPRKARKVKVTR